MILSVHFFKTLGELGFKFNPTLIRPVYYSADHKLLLFEIMEEEFKIPELEKILLTPMGVIAVL